MSAAAAPLAGVKMQHMEVWLTSRPIGTIDSIYPIHSIEALQHKAAISCHGHIPSMQNVTCSLTHHTRCYDSLIIHCYIELLGSEDT